MKYEYLSKVISSFRYIMKMPHDTIILDFSNVEYTNQGTKMVLFAQLEKAYMKGKEKVVISQKTPKHKDVINTLIEPKQYLHKNINTIPGAQKNHYINTELVSDIVSELRRIGIKGNYDPFYSFLIELIGNATEHGICNKNINWWLLRYKDANEMIYVFVDMGVGIIKSYRKAGFIKWYEFPKPEKIICEAFSGKLGSSTKEPNRGGGLPSLKNCIEKGYISNFELITNDVYLHCNNGKLDAKRIPYFVGTYFSWTINKENYNTWKNLKS